LFVSGPKTSLSDPDKGPGTILSTKLSLQTRARAHALSSSYERSFLVVERLGAHPDGTSKTFPYKGAPHCFWAVVLFPLSQQIALGCLFLGIGILMFVSSICSLSISLGWNIFFVWCLRVSFLWICSLTSSLGTQRTLKVLEPREVGMSQGWRSRGARVKCGRVGGR